MFFSKSLLGNETKEEEKRQKKGGGAYQGRGAYWGQYGKSCLKALRLTFQVLDQLTKSIKIT